MWGLRTPELILIVAAVVLFFGAKRLPQLGAGVGGMLHGFRKAMKGGGEPLPPRTDDGGDRA